jgi:hypothetical protein
MRTGQPIIGRPAWYDRNPVQKVYNQRLINASPHSETTQITYTCPSGKKAMVEVMSLTVRRNTAPTTAGQALAYFSLTPSGGSATRIMETYINSATVNDRADSSIGTSIILLSGDKIEGKTYDLSTGGTCDYFLALKLTEFDA